MAARSLRWVKDVLSRSMQLEHKRSHGPDAAAEKGRGPAVDPATSPCCSSSAPTWARASWSTTRRPSWCATCSSSTTSSASAAGPGWKPCRSRLVGRALTEAEILQLQEPSSLLTTIIETLRSIKIDAEARAAQAVQDALEREWEREQPAIPEVSETNYDEYELMERSWVGTVPAGLDLSDRSLSTR